MKYPTLVKFYEKQENEVLHRMVEEHRIEIWNAIRDQDERKEYVRKRHLEAVKHVLEQRF